MTFAVTHPGMGVVSSFSTNQFLFPNKSIVHGQIFSSPARPSWETQKSDNTWTIILNKTHTYFNCYFVVPELTYKVKDRHK